MTLPGPFAGSILLLNGIIGFFISFLIFKRNPTEILNKLISIAMVAYSSYLFFRGVIFSLPLSMLSTFDFFRDISLTGAIVASSFALMSGLYSWKGEEYIKQISILGTIIGLTIISIIIGVFFDSVVYDEQTDIITNQFTAPIGAVGVLIIPLVFMSIAVVAYISTFLTIEKNSPLYKKALILPVGLIFITSGIAYSAIMAAIGYPPISILADIFYIIGSLLLFVAFR
ncbi:MAG: hypothetical protein ACFFBD_20640 [Candidatus Hodarchaeota archaeon]